MRSTRTAKGSVDTPDAELVARVVVSDDREAFSELVRRYQGKVRTSLRKLTRGDDGLADDLAQEAFVLAYYKLGQFRFDAKFSTWLYRIAYNVFVSERRKMKEAPLADDDNRGHREPAAARLDHLDIDLARALASLTEAERAVVVQCYYNDLTHEHASYVLGMPLGTVKTTLGRAKEKLKSAMTVWKDEVKL